MTTTTTTIAMDLNGAAQALQGYGDALKERFLERDAEVRGLLLAVIAKANVLLLGPPGTAKSALTTAFAEGLGMRSFVRLMGRTTVPEELFGPYSLSGLEHDRFERVTEGYLPTAEVAFLDEVFKANSAVLNALLTALNEKAFDQGPVREAIPLEVCVGASNEYPQDDGLAALYDRFLVRFWVDYLRSESSFETMLTASSAPMPILDRGVIELLRSAAVGVDLAPVIPMVIEIRAALAREHGITASDRRWRQAMGLIRASAVLDGRMVAAPRDLTVLCDCLWDRAEQADAIRAVVTSHRAPALNDALRVYALVLEEIDKLPALGTLKMDEIAKAGNAIAQVRRYWAEAKGIAGDDREAMEIVSKIEKVDADLQAAVSKATRRMVR